MCWHSFGASGGSLVRIFLQCLRPGSSLTGRRILEREWIPTPVFTWRILWTGSLAGYSPLRCKSQTRLSNFISTFWHPLMSKGHYQRQDVHIYFSAIRKWTLINALKTILLSVLVTYKKGILEFWVCMWDESLSFVNDSSPNSVTRLHRIRAKKLDIKSTGSLT